MKIFYATRSVLPNLRAHSIQIFNTCSSLGELRDTEVSLIAAHRKLSYASEAAPHAWPGNPEMYAGVAQTFRLVRPARLTFQKLCGIDHRTRFFKAMVQHLKKTYDDQSVVYTRTSKFALALSKLGYHVALEIHDKGYFENPIVQTLIENLRTGNAGSFLGFVAISDTLAASFRDAGISEKHLLVAHDGIDVRRFDGAGNVYEARQRLVARLREEKPAWFSNSELLAPDRPAIGYCGHFYPGRGLEMLIDCAARRPEWTFFLIGGLGEDLARLQQSAKDKGLQNVIFTGYLPNPQVPALLQACDVLSMPYEKAMAGSYFMSPMKMFEYMACRRAIVTADWPQIQEVLTPESNALFHARGDVDGMEQAFARLFADPTFREQLAQQSRADVEAYTWLARGRNIISWVKARIAD